MLILITENSLLFVSRELNTGAINGSIYSRIRIYNKRGRDKLFIHAGNTVVTELGAIRHAGRANFIYCPLTAKDTRQTGERERAEMRLQVTERIVLIYSNVSVVRAGKNRYRIRGENVTAKHCRECGTGGRGVKGSGG